MASGLNSGLSKKTFVFGLKVWVLMGITVGLFIIIILVVLICLTSRKRSRRVNGMLPLSHMLSVSEEIKDISVDQVSANNHLQNGGFVSLNDKFSDRESEKVLIQTKNGDNSSQSGSFNHIEKDAAGSQSGEESGAMSISAYRSSSHPITAPSPLCGLPEFSHLGWGHWFTLRDLEHATNRFSRDNVIGEGGYGVVYRGQLINGNPVAVKKILNNL
ncbi:putative receptor-like protein kinase [Senna tora]|uniref:non-specific serine/threonine protein kinase n=1 Tax=Senna tora TaxID=362788 RepID=A0A834X2B7_9FABA|nr:putative receptor-like protein kinase [Senna tora]